ncbi:hypothetical protein [Spirosoma litoris]
MPKLTINYPVKTYRSVQVDITKEEADKLALMGNLERAMFIYIKHPSPDLIPALSNQEVRIDWESN